jgi:integrase
MAATNRHIDLDTRVDALRAAVVSSQSRRIYLSSQKRYIFHLLMQRDDDIVTRRFRSQYNRTFGSRLTPIQNELEGLQEQINNTEQEEIFIALQERILNTQKQIHKVEKEIKKFIIDALEKAPDNPPLIFERINARDFLKWICSLEKDNGDPPSASTYKLHRSALYDLFRKFRLVYPQELEVEMKHHYSGLLRDVAVQINEGEGKAQVGKEPLEFSLYKVLAKRLLSSKFSETMFAHTFLCLCWNLMCRASSAIAICFSNLEWKEDALRIYFAHQKNDQMGERKRDPRHIYANPKCPQICPILSLGIYLICLPPHIGQKKLFPGEKQYDRYRKFLLRHLTEYDMQTSDLTARGIEPSDIGTHSIRKGSTSYCASGTTSGPPSIATQLRAGWSLPGVQDTYYRYEKAGDMHVGRTVTGLKPDTISFGILPPFFITEPPIVHEMLRSCFPSTPDRLNRVTLFCMASLIYHRNYLRRELPTDHPLFYTPLYADNNKLEMLSQLIECRLQEKDDPIVSTGIPFTVSFLVAMNKLQDGLKSIVPAVKEVVNSGFDRLSREMDERQVHTGILTPQMLQDGIDRCFDNALQRSGIVQLMDRFETREQESTVEDTGISQIANSVTHAPYYTNGHFYRIQPSFDIPRLTLLLAFQLWCCGNPSTDHIPLRKLTSSQFSTTNKQKRFVEFKFLMEMMENELKSEGKWLETPSIDDANAMFVEAKTVFSTIAYTAKGKKRRISQISWSTAAKELRMLQRHRRDASNQSIFHAMN